MALTLSAYLISLLFFLIEFKWLSCIYTIYKLTDVLCYCAQPSEAHRVRTAVRSAPQS
jgi:hypothetical protein